MYAYTVNSFRYVGDSGEPLPGEQIAEQVPEQVLHAIAVQQGTLRRDAALRASDWTQLPTSGLAADKVQEWADYRGALIALLADPDFPHCEWPAEPSA